LTEAASAVIGWPMPGSNVVSTAMHLGKHQEWQGAPCRLLHRLDPGGTFGRHSWSHILPFFDRAPF
jgi:hypothetical protein